MELRCLLKVVIYCVFALICFSQCYTILVHFFSYPIFISVSDVSSSLISILPGITICNNNRLSLKKLVKRRPEIAAAMEERYPGWTKRMPSYLDRREFNNYRDEVARILQRFNYSPTDEMAVSPLDKIYDMKPDNEPFIKRFECARTWTDSIECGDLKKVDSIQDRRCATLLYKGAMYNDAYHRPHLFNSTQKKTTKGNHTYFHAKEVIKILLDFQPEDYADLKRQIGSRIIFHDNGLIGSTHDLDFYVTRGYKYDFNIDRRDLDLSQDPKTGCADYSEVNLYKYADKIDPRVPLLVEGCFQNCLVHNVINYSNCWPPTMPYFRNDTLDPDRSLKPCNWFVGIHQIPLVRYVNATNTSLPQSMDPEHLRSRTKMRTYRKMKRFCWSQCAPACRFSSYSITVTRSVWPTDVQILFDKDTDEQRHLRHCCGLITIKYAHFHYSVQEVKQKYDWTETLGNIGGLLAVWLGFSIVSIYRGIQRLVIFCTERASLAKVDIEKRGIY